MGYIVAYLLLTVVVDLLLEMIRVTDGRDISWVHRRLWNDTVFDCRSPLLGSNVHRNGGRLSQRNSTR